MTWSTACGRKWWDSLIPQWLRAQMRCEWCSMQHTSWWRYNFMFSVFCLRVILEILQLLLQSVKIWMFFFFFFHISRWLLRACKSDLVWAPCVEQHTSLWCGWKAFRATNWFGKQMKREHKISRVCLRIRSLGPLMSVHFNILSQVKFVYKSSALK